MENITFLAAFNIFIPNYVNEIILGDFKIRKRTNEELQNYYGIETIEINSYGGVNKFVYNKDKHSKIHWLFLEQIGANCNYFIEFSQDASVNIRKNLSNFLTALRLSKFGKVEIPIIFSTDLKQFQNVKTTLVKEEELMILDKEEIFHIYKFYKNISHINEPKYNLVIERFENAISASSNYENAFVDLIGILESIVLQNKQDELRYRF